MWASRSITIYCNKVFFLRYATNETSVTLSIILLFLVVLHDFFYDPLEATILLPSNKSLLKVIIWKYRDIYLTSTTKPNTQRCLHHQNLQLKFYCTILLGEEMSLRLVYIYAYFTNTSKKYHYMHRNRVSGRPWPEKHNIIHTFLVATTPCLVDNITWTTLDISMARWW
jgi:hypothetical protein